ncbi:MAG: nuclear transport factor 2 family protein [Candidatus Kariarchaeaceae archaeon]|jgi:hypothetical protein
MPHSIEAIVDAHTNAYRSRDIDALIKSVHENIRILDFQSGEVLMEGIDEIRKRYQETFDNSPNLQLTRINRIIQGKVIIDNIRVTGLRGDTTAEGVEIYEVKDDRISRKWFIH